MADGHRLAAVADRRASAGVALAPCDDLAGHRIVDAAQRDELGPGVPRVGEGRVRRVRPDRSRWTSSSRSRSSSIAGVRQRTSSHISASARLRSVRPSVASAHHGVMSVATRVSATAESSQASSRGPRTVAIAVRRSSRSRPRGVPEVLQCSEPRRRAARDVRRAPRPSQAQVGPLGRRADRSNATDGRRRIVGRVRATPIASCRPETLEHAADEAVVAGAQPQISFRR